METKRLVSSKGQVVVPKTVREYLNLKEGDQLQFSIRETGEVVIVPIKRENPEGLFGSLPPQSKNTEDFEKVLYQAKEERMKRRKQEGNI